MKFLVSLSCYAALILAGSAQSTDRVSDLQRRCAEQERQIERLELENSRLRSLQGEVTTEPTEAPTNQPVEEKLTPSPTPPATAATSGQPLHVVKKGETLSGIAKKHGIETSELAKLNAISNAGMISIGQKLKLPVPATQSSSPAQTADTKVVRGTHKVKKGETFFSIARTYGLSVEALSSANPNVSPRSMRIGQELQLVALRTESTAPSNTPEAPAPAESSQEPTGLAGSQTILNRRPTVRRVPITENITLQKFADEYSMDVARLKRLNGLTEEQYQPNTVLAEGSALFVSAQPLD